MRAKDVNDWAKRIILKAIEQDREAMRKADEAVAYFRKEKERMSVGAGWLSRHDPEEFERRQKAYQRYEEMEENRIFEN